MGSKTVFTRPNELSVQTGSDKVQVSNPFFFPFQFYQWSILTYQLSLTSRVATSLGAPSQAVGQHTSRSAQSVLFCIYAH